MIAWMAVTFAVAFLVVVTFLPIAIFRPIVIVVWHIITYLLLVHAMRRGGGRIGSCGSGFKRKDE